MLTPVIVKKAILNLRLRPEIRDEFAIAAELRGASMSSLLHQFIVRTIREEKEHSPQSFRKPAQKVNGNIEPVPDHLVAMVPHLGELTDETAGQKRKTNKKKAGGKR